jgi:uncharacterized protein YeaO (DUF488 family)
MQWRIPASRVNLKRAYRPPSTRDGTRILVDRLWPRGIRKSEAAIDRWIRTIAPTGTLRAWFGHDLGRWREFRRRYAAELRGHPDELAELRALARRGPITLVFAAKDEAHNNAVVLRAVLLGGRISPSPVRARGLDVQAP